MKEKIIGNLLYGQSGGPTTVINASAYGLFKEAFKHNDIIKNVYSMIFGLDGFLEENIIKIDKNDPHLEKLLNTPGAIFGSSRYCIDDNNNEKILEKILNIFKKYNIRYFFYNGGNDSMDTIYKIDSYFKMKKYNCYCIGIPKTVDNDLVYTDHTPGFGSAAKFVANITTQIYIDDHSYKNGRVNIIEAMGRDTGWLTASAILSSINNCKPDLIYIPEIDFDLEDFLSRVKNIYEKNKHCLVVISEGIHYKNKEDILKNQNQVDSFNHVQYGGVSHFLTHVIENRFGFRTRAYELSLLQRTSSTHPSEIDLIEAQKAGSNALRFALKGKTGKMVVIKRIQDNPYKVKYCLVDLDLVKNQVKYLPLTYYDSINCTIKESYIDYCLPLIWGKEKAHFKNGLINIYKLEK